MKVIGIISFAVLLVFGLPLHATIFGKIQGIVHDPQHRPVAGAAVQLQAITSDWSRTAQADSNGDFSFTAVPVGDYKITVMQSKFETLERTVTVASGSSPILHFQLAIAALTQTTVVSGQSETVNMDSVTPTTLIDREDIAETPGADRTNSMAMITDYTPAAYVTHDMLHMRGGHQVDWLIDGVPIPNTNIATNLGPQIDPKDIDYLEIQRGSYDAEYGDRTYGVFNIVPRSGFERDNEAELVTSFGNWHQTNDQTQFQRAHASASRITRASTQIAATTVCSPPSGKWFTTPRTVMADSRPSSSTPVPPTNSGWSPRCARIITRSPSTRIPTQPEIRFIPVTAFTIASANPMVTSPSPGIHTFNPNLLMTVSPFYHYNQASYNGGRRTMCR